MNHIFSDADTIAAAATAWGESGVGIIRISGPCAGKILGQIFRNSSSAIPVVPTGNPPAECPPTISRSSREMVSHHLYHGYIVDPADGRVVDEVLAVLMRAPSSYTGEEVVEIQGHGGPLVMRTILELVLARNARPARRGEFTLRAFLNRRLDLAQAEAVLDLVKARSAGGLEMAIGQLQGRLSAQVAAWREELLDLLAHLEAMVDFPEDEVSPLPAERLDARISAIRAGLLDSRAGAGKGRIYREGVRVVIAGPPNAGKSSLLNALLRERRALVTPLPGTTRDSIEEWINIGGIPFLIADTAGLCDTLDLVESMGVERARGLLEQADLVLLVLDVHDPPDEPGMEFLARAVGDRPGILILNKQDLPARLDSNSLIPPLSKWPHARCCLLDPASQTVASGIEGSASQTVASGIEQLEKRLVETAQGGEIPAPGELTLCNLRHIRAIEETIKFLEAALDTVHTGLPADFITVDLSAALATLEGITGQQVTEDVLERVFERFCIGK